MAEDPLPSWRDGAARAALVEFLDASNEMPPEKRLAVFDNDGTLWCEKPRYPQLDFFEWELRRAVSERPELQEIPEFAAVLDGDKSELGRMGLERVAVALLGLFQGWEPKEFDNRVRAFFEETRHPDTGRRYSQMVYQPMIELLAALQARGFTNCIVTGGGTEFVRAISRTVYGVEAERVVGTLVTYEVADRDGRNVLVRTNQPQGQINEGNAKISNIQLALGRTPVLAAGNSPGDAAMLEYTNSLDGPSLALLVNHDDAEREYAYESLAGTFDATERVEATAARLGWTQVSMLNDWSTVFTQP